MATASRASSAHVSKKDAAKKQGSEHQDRWFEQEQVAERVVWMCGVSLSEVRHEAVQTQSDVSFSPKGQSASSTARLLARVLDMYSAAKLIGSISKLSL